MILPVVLPLFIGEFVIAPVPDALTVVGSMPDPSTVVVHEYVVPPMVDVGRKFNAVPLQISMANWADVFVMTGLGETVITTSTKLPEQPFADGVIRYVAVPVLMPSTDVSC